MAEDNEWMILKYTVDPWFDCLRDTKDVHKYFGASSIEICKNCKENKTCHLIDKNFVPLELAQRFNMTYGQP